jgi:peptide/nickel transport system ATP-binding protein/peptide/nickel transport system permease protein
VTFWLIGSVRSDHRSWQPLGQNLWATSGLVLVLMVTLSALAAPLLPLSDPTSTDLTHRMLPALSPNHLLGTDHLGRDLLARTVGGTRASLAVGVFATLIAALFGTLIGLVAGYYRRGLDAFLMRGVDILMAFPYLLFALAIVAALGPSLHNAMTAIAVVNIPFFARAVRGSVVRLSQLEFIAAARLSGQGDVHILTTELLPNVLPAIVVMMGTAFGLDDFRNSRTELPGARRATSAGRFG